MIWRLIVLGVIGAALVLIAAFSAVESGVLYAAGQQVYAISGSASPDASELVRANQLFQDAQLLQMMILPLAAGGLMALLAVLVVLARRRQLRGVAVRPPAPAR